MSWWKTLRPLVIAFVLMSVIYALTIGALYLAFGEEAFKPISSGVLHEVLYTLIVNSSIDIESSSKRIGSLALYMAYSAKPQVIEVMAYLGEPLLRGPPL